MSSLLYQPILVLTKNFLQYTIIFGTPEPSQKLFASDKLLRSFLLKEPLRGWDVIEGC